MGKNITETISMEEAFFHAFHHEIESFVRFSFRCQVGIIIGSSLLVFGVILLLNEVSIAIAFLILGGLGTLISSILYFTNSIKGQLDKIGVYSLPYLACNLQGSTVVVDLAAISDSRTFNFPMVEKENIKTLHSEYSEFNALLKKIPIILSPQSINKAESINEDDYGPVSEEREMLQHIDRLNEIINSSKIAPISIPLVSKYSPILRYLRENNSQSERHPKIFAMDKEAAIEKLRSIDGIVAGFEANKSDALDVDDICNTVIAKCKVLKPRYDYIIDTTLSEVLPSALSRLNFHLYNNTNNYYCPSCNKEVLEFLESGNYYHNKNEDSKKVQFKKNTRMVYIEENQLNGWKCLLCEQTTNDPIPKNLLDDELFTPVYDKLFEENYKERLSIYNNINDQKRSYVEKASSELHRVLRESRSKQDNIKSKIRTIGANLKMEANSIRHLQEHLVQYKQLECTKQSQIIRDIENIKQEISAENERARHAIDRAANEAAQNIEASTEKYANLEREDQAKRDTVQRQMAHDIRSMREIEEVRAHRQGMNKRKGLPFFRKSDRQRISKKLKK